MRFVVNHGQGLKDVEGLDLIQIVKQALRIVYSNMHNVPVVDIAFALQCLPVLQDSKTIQKFTLRLQDTFEMVNPALLKQVYNQESLLDILIFFRRYRLGKISFREKIASFL